jgi:hypothetical protein
MNLLQCHEQYFLKSATVRYIWMNLSCTTENGRFRLLAIVPPLYSAPHNYRGPGSVPLRHYCAVGAVGLYFFLGCCEGASLKAF